MRKPYFRSRPGDPAPLSACVTREVRFEEVDPLGIVWHGRYPSYFEDARVALGARFGLGYLDFYEKRLVTPIKQMIVDYHHPLRFGDAARIQSLMHYTEAARINFEFRITNQEGRLTTTGCSVQLMLDESLELLVTPPPFYAAFLDRWRTGELAGDSETSGEDA